MSGYLIKDTTKEEMYQAYIDGEKELREINMEFNARYVSGMEGPERRGCPME